MGVRDIMPWGRSSQSTPSHLREMAESPFMALHRDVNRLFDDLVHGFDMPMAQGHGSLWGGWPNVEVSETEKEIRLTAEVPGLDEKDCEILLQDGVLTLRGEKRAEVEDKERHFSERYYGRFERRFPLGMEIDEDKVTASFKNGVLTIVLPKTKKAMASAKRIPIDGKH
jgi:HSP20 family protein